MTEIIIGSMLASLLLTIILELAFALIWGVRQKRDLIVNVLCNTLTNPVVSCIYYYCYFVLGLSGAGRVVALILLEISAVLTEWLIYKKKTDINRPMLFSLGANGFSYFTGLLISLIM